ncbi:MAG: transcription-repair coupling factor [Gammaproteobacteria bacterium]|nr:MAG: transcription-repair coupling factor [Gammaproteobacteria bacterium]
MPDYLSLFEPTAPQNQANATAHRLYGSSPALLIKSLREQKSKQLLLIITPDTTSAYRLKTQIEFFNNNEECVDIFPDWETLPYDKFSPHQDIISQRLATLYRLKTYVLKKSSCATIIIPAPTLIQKLPPTDYVSNHSLIVKLGDTLNIGQIRSNMEQSGYICVPEVIEHGEFAVRGSIIDIFPMGSHLPFRIDLFDDEVETIRTFDPETQLTIEKVEDISLLPAREFPFNENAIKKFRQEFRARFEGDPQRCTIYRDISNGLAPNGIEYYMPLFHDKVATIFDYLPQDTSVISFEDTPGAIDHYWEQINHRHEQLRHDIENPILIPDELFISSNDIKTNLQNFSLLTLNSFETEKVTTSINNYATTAPPALKVQARLEKPTAQLQSFIDSFDGKILICAETIGRRESLIELLKANKIYPKKTENWAAFLKHDKKLAITVGDIDEGFVHTKPNIALIAESQLLAERAAQKRRRKHSYKDNESRINNLTDLTEGTPVVHIDHGVGRYIGLQTLDVNGTTTEFLTLEYANSDKLYVPVASLHLISRYNGSVEEKAPLHRLGTDQWEKAKKRASERIRDVAAELLEVYAQRATKQGHSYSFETMEYSLFAESFPFEETPDQETAIDAVLTDMQAATPMDRVVCGDVGFGKTEVAMRAAFIGVHNNRQVALLVPTTLLATQHYQNFCDRFADWPVKIECLSRFNTKKQQDTILADLKEGKIDIIIGTHKLIQDDIKFENLGLVIIDEEHRFGVRQKEQFKKLRSEVDILTLTATPIPRTLNMAMSGLRDLSIIATPPAKRMAIKTFVSEWNNALFQEACLRELKRGGQVYFLHNDVKTMEKISADLQELIPEATVRFAHGQMRESELEQVMLDFYHQRFNLLVCSTIIESGIDVPTANTIIINRADKLGLAQLHQLRGRVGRSHHRAYAYMITPPKGVMTSDAVKRLEAIESLEDLGSGLMLANHDLEIRGAGELLGDEQSGQIQEIGFTLYTDLLQRAIDALKAGKIPDMDASKVSGTEIDLRIPAIIPEDYIPDVHMRLVLYKRIASVSDSEQIKDLQIEMIDRFGLLPEHTKKLFDLAQLRLTAEEMGISKIDFGPAGGIVIFDNDTSVDPVKIIKLIQFQPDRYKLEGENKLKVKRDLKCNEERYKAVTDLINGLNNA